MFRKISNYAPCDNGAFVNKWNNTESTGTLHI